MVSTYRRLEHRDATVRLTHAEIGSHPEAETTVLLAPDAIGVCRSDLREINGTRHLRRDFGHEIVGTVVSSDPPGTVPTGQRVVLDPHPAVGRTSGFADLVEIWGSRSDVTAALVPLPETSGTVRSVFVEPLACVCHCLGRLDSATQEAGADPIGPVAILGAGMAGTLMATVLDTSSVPVTLINRSRGRLSFLIDRGVLPPAALHTADGPLGPAVPRVIVATAATDTGLLDLAAERVTPGGVVLLYAGTRPGQTYAGVDLDSLRREERTARITRAGKSFHIVGSHGATREDFVRAIHLLDPRTPGRQELPRRLDRMVTTVLSLDESADLLNRLARGPFMGKAVILPSPSPDSTKGLGQ
ncbi:alcohol dehydrogenase catalytic domain-containing protein [Streptomyces clavuligerus]|uniref:2-deoxy-scyllo-inosamine dehydrogenase n=1 Tax=Streptomyces clavuligerus TaxID=1901 RepID=B5GMF4_STRCL|nr:alcohol dehydrogenase catalytic domain-containing protein [Streptomyces clavuligerus]ANW22369.1 alcohol dehydrogenase [Streptomyces clavuligerus]AXU17273.1 alcohol dehydrogenase [Streptomyces clavuligerus]EDY47500.1 hypothetical protein SSCG_00528 [Streptomyces clavuligerus]EFG04460.1 Alcohol dehydrogenase GroES domain protein [Streptomyces clavuligerus]MBY6307082.1 alcohol dehydrogenase catalytic domain-containing protein [Streptomyces clavuligerus]